MNFTCPICKAPTAKATHADFPFCSERCRLVDLGRWFAEDYRVEGKPAPRPDEPRADD